MKIIRIIVAIITLVTLSIGAEATQHMHTQKPLKNKEYYKNGKLRYEVVYDKKDKNIYTKKLYLPTGQLKATSRFAYKKLDGKSQRFYDNGKIQKITTFKNGIKNGTENIFYESGKLRQTTPYVNGKLNGHVKVYREENGKLAMDDNVKDDKLVSRKVFGDNGKAKVLLTNYKKMIPMKGQCYTKTNELKDMEESDLYDYVVYGKDIICK